YSPAYAAGDTQTIAIARIVIKIIIFFIDKPPLSVVLYNSVNIYIRYYIKDLSENKDPFKNLCYLQR
ncbi:MAG: hypothetical protein ACI4RB_03770, partial [Acutalibacteraceae bacterium]